MDNPVMHSSAAANIMKVTCYCGTRLNSTSVTASRVLAAEMSWRWYVGHAGPEYYIRLQQASIAQVVPAPSVCFHVPTLNSSSSIPLQRRTLQRGRLPGAGAGAGVLP